MRRVVVKWTVIGLVVLLIVIQFVPYGRDHTNPTGGKPIKWDSKRTQELMAGACMDCHSNETKWPWYSNVAPVSWLVQKDVDEGRRKLNLSTDAAEVQEMIEAIDEGSMPPLQYKPSTPARGCSTARRRSSPRGFRPPSGAEAAAPALHGAPSA